MNTHAHTYTHILQVTSAWQEHCDIEYSKNLTFDTTGHGEADSKTSFTIELHTLQNDSADTDTPGERPVLKITLPEMFNVDVRADDAIINFRKKLMGDVSLDCNSGDVCVDQLRGEYISLQCNNGNFTLMQHIIYIYVVIYCLKHMK